MGKNIKFYTAERKVISRLRRRILRVDVGRMLSGEDEMRREILGKKIKIKKNGVGKKNKL